MTTSKYKRECPVCGKVIYHTSKCNLDKMVKKNSPCRECYFKSKWKYNSETFTRACVKCKGTKVFANRHSYSQSVDRGVYICRHCIISEKGPRSEETKNKISKTKSETPEEIKQERCRIRRQRRAEKFLSLGYPNPRINPIACRFMDDWGTVNGYKFRHGLNGGEVYFPHAGAFVDGYDGDKNVIFEYDEPHHYNSKGQLRIKDIRRMSDLIQLLNCTVIRYDEKRQTIKEYNQPIS